MVIFWKNTDSWSPECHTKRVRGWCAGEPGGTREGRVIACTRPAALPPELFLKTQLWGSAPSRDGADGLRRPRNEFWWFQNLCLDSSESQDGKTWMLQCFLVFNFWGLPGKCWWDFQDFFIEKWILYGIFCAAVEFLLIKVNYLLFYFCPAAKFFLEKWILYCLFFPQANFFGRKWIIYCICLTVFEVGASMWFRVENGTKVGENH